MNTFGRNFAVTTFGESHGPAVGAVIDGCPARLALTAADIQPLLDRRRPGTSSLTSARDEADTVEILSGVFEGMTTGAPIALLVRNRDTQSKDYEAIKEKFRPGHADFTYQEKYGIRDYRGGGRSRAGRLSAGMRPAPWHRSTLPDGGSLSPAGSCPCMAKPYQRRSNRRSSRQRRPGTLSAGSRRLSQPAAGWPWRPGLRET